MTEKALKFRICVGQMSSFKLTLDCPVFPPINYLLWCSSGENGPVCNHCFGLSLLIHLAPPLSVVSSREHRKTNTMPPITRQRSTFSRQTKTNSLLRPELRSLNRGKKNKKWSVTFELTFWPIQLTSRRKIQTRT